MATKTIKYIGTAPLPEEPITGSKRVWDYGQTQSVDSVVATQLLTTGLFEDDAGTPVSAKTNPLTGEIEISTVVSTADVVTPMALRRSIAKLNAGSGHIAVYGNSITAGAGAGATDAEQASLGFVGRLRALFDSSGSDFGIIHPSENFSSNFTLAGSAVLNGGNNSHGLNGYRVDIPASALADPVNKVTFTATGALCSVYGFALTTGVSARAKVGSADWQNVPPAYSVAGPNNGFYQRWDFAMPGGVNTVSFAGGLTDNVYIYGIMGLKNADRSGVIVSRLGRSGTVGPDLISLALDGTDTAGPAWRTTLSANQKLQQTRSVSSEFGVDLAIVCLDANDMTGGWTTYAYTLADIKRHAKNLIAALTAEGADVLIYCGPPRSTASNGAGIGYTQAQVVEQYKSAAAESDRCAFASLSERYPHYASWNSDGFAADVVHPFPAGHLKIAGHLRAVLRRCGLNF